VCGVKGGADDEGQVLTISPAFDSATFRHVLGHYPTGVCVVTAVDPDGSPVGMVVGSFTSVSLAPPLVAFFPDKGSSSWPRIEQASRFCVNVLASDQQEVCTRFAAKGPDKFAGIAHKMSTNGSPVLDDVVAWIDCNLHAVHEAGDHFIAVGEVVELATLREAQPMLFFQGKYGEFALPNS
jgi:3-hydroxy-9,10-secoandrosta-1,3,5(10)-triene-9,17-dione monooxygenase reductase component